MAGNGDRLKPLLRPGPQREGARPGSPALKRRAIERIECRSTYLVDDHKRRAIERIEYLPTYSVDDHNRRAIERIEYLSTCSVEDHKLGYQAQP